MRPPFGRGALAMESPRKARISKLKRLGKDDGAHPSGKQSII